MIASVLQKWTGTRRAAVRYRGAQAQQRRAQRLVVNGLGLGAEHFGIDLRRRLPLGNGRRRDLALEDLQCRDRLIAVEPVDALDYARHHVLELERAALGHPQDHGAAALDAVARRAGGARPADPFGHADLAEVFADDRRPLAEDLGIGKAVAREHRFGQLAKMLVESIHGGDVRSETVCPNIGGSGGHDEGESGRAVTTT
jgi:hypothetical protein